MVTKFAEHSEVDNNTIHIVNDRIAVKVSSDTDNVLQSTATGLKVTQGRVGSVLKKYLTLNSSYVIQGDPTPLPDRAVLMNRNGMNILHLDIKFKDDLNITQPGHRPITIADIPSGSPSFATLVEHQINNGLGFIYVEAGRNRVYAKGIIPRDTRYILDLIGFSR